MGSATLNSSWQFHADREPGTKKAFTLSLVAHLLLLALLTMGISWKTSSPAGLEVELWDASVPTQTITPAPTIEVKQEAADIAIKKTKVNPDPPKEVIKKVEPKPEKKAEVKLPEKKVDSKDEATAKKATAAAEKARADQLARLKAAAGAEGGSGGKWVMVLVQVAMLPQAMPIGCARRSNRSLSLMQRLFLGTPRSLSCLT